MSSEAFSTGGMTRGDLDAWMKKMDELIPELSPTSSAQMKDRAVVVRPIPERSPNVTPRMPYRPRPESARSERLSRLTPWLRRLGAAAAVATLPFLLQQAKSTAPDANGEEVVCTSDEVAPGSLTAPSAPKDNAVLGEETIAGLTNGDEAAYTVDGMPVRIVAPSETSAPVAAEVCQVQER